MTPRVIAQARLLKDRFPHWVFSRVILVQALLTLCLFVCLGFFVRAYFRSELASLLSAQDMARILSDYDSAFIFFFIGLALVLGVFAVVLARHLVFPIGRMIVKTRSVLHPDLQAGKNEERLDPMDEESDSVWSDLESSIEEIRRDLQTKIESLKTEREEQATLMGAISDAILAVDLDEAPLFYNSRFALQFGGQDLGKNVPMRLWQIFRTPEILMAFHKALKEGRSETVKALPFDQPGGKRFFSLSVSPLRNTRESIYGAVGIFHDVTDLKRAEQIRIDFVANVSHELRTPLTAIKGYADTLKLDMDQGRALDPEFLQVIVRNTDRLMNLINDLLDLSSLESTDVLQKARLSTQEVTSRVIQQLHGAYQAKRQRVVVSADATTVLADPKRLEQVLVNLLDNANKYTPEEGTITVAWSSAPTETLLLVSDTGPGIPSEHQPRLFERFYRVDKARSREKGGTGLGLAIVKHILQRHEGSVAVESSPGSGTTFICRFPN